MPLDLEQPNDNSGRLFVVEQGGTIRIIQNGAVLPQPFFDITSKVINQEEMGLLGLTFHPGFKADRKFYVNYVRNSGGQFQSVIAEYTASAANANQADPATERILLTVDRGFVECVTRCVSRPVLLRYVEGEEQRHRPADDASDPHQEAGEEVMSNQRTGDGSWQKDQC